MKEKPYNLKRPKGIEAYILAHANRQYIFSDKDKNAYCTACKKTFKAAAVQNVEGVCPKCGAKVIYKEKRYGRKKLEENGRILWFTKKGKATYAQLDMYDIDYTGDRPKVSLWEDAQYKFSKKESLYFRREIDYYTGEHWNQRNNIILPSPAKGIWWTLAKYEKTYIYKPSLCKVGTDMKYATLTEKINSPYAMIGYFDNFLKYQSIELLEKAGFEEIVEVKSLGIGSRSINWRGKSLEKILKLSRSEIKAFREYLANHSQALDSQALGALEKYHKVKKIDNRITFYDLEYLTNWWRINDVLEDIANITDLRKALDYIKKQNESTKVTVLDYADYLSDCKKLDFNLNDRHVLRPANFENEHHRVSSMVAVAKDEITNKNFKKEEKKITKDIAPYRFNDLEIMPAQGVEDLINESEALGHCVKTYAEKVADGRTAILFIRNINSPEKPFYTLELSPKYEIIQCRGYHNCGMTDEVKEFVSEWEKHIKKQKRKKVA